MNKRLIRYGIGVAIMLCASVAFASNWITVGTVIEPNAPKCAAYAAVDTSTWSYRGNQTVRAWAKTVYGPNHSSCPKEDYQEWQSFEDYNCATRMTRLVAHHSTDWLGHVESSDDSAMLSQPWHVVSPDTIGEAELNYVCAAH